MNINTAGAQALRSTFVLGLGLGMRESSGQYCEGWDVAAGSHRSSAEGEAGLYQVSYDSISATPELSALYDEYQRHPERCHLQTFKVGVGCRPRSVLGTGSGAEFQTFVKSCPAFVTEYAMSLLRVRRGDFGPINRREAEVVPQCETTLKRVQALVDSDTESYCQELL